MPSTLSTMKSADPNTMFQEVKDLMVKTNYEG